MCMNKFTMSSEFLSGSLRSHKQTKFSRGRGRGVLQRAPNPQLLLWLAVLATSKTYSPPPPHRHQPTAPMSSRNI